MCEAKVVGKVFTQLLPQRMSLKRTNEAADLIYNIGGMNHFPCKTQGIVVGSTIKDARNFGYARTEKLELCAVFHVLSSINIMKARMKAVGNNRSMSP